MIRLVPTLALAAAATLAHAGVVAADEPSPQPSAPAWLVAPRDATQPSRPPSYFERHAARVQRDLLHLHHGYTLETMRERDALALYGRTPGTSVSTSLGIGLFSMVVVAAAHTPAPLRFAFDRALHVGPAIFDNGGMGAGFGGRM